jgi:hypothetical protein
MLSTLRSFANAILGKVPGKPDRLDAATPMAMDADLGAAASAGSAREPESEVNPIGERERILKDGK